MAESASSCTYKRHVPLLLRNMSRGLRRLYMVALASRRIPVMREAQAMARAARDRLARTLRGDTQTAFSVELPARPAALTLEFEGFGRAKLPLTPPQAPTLPPPGHPPPPSPA